MCSRKLKLIVAVLFTVFSLAACNPGDDFPSPGVTPPAAPGIPTVTAGNAQLTVTWTAVTGATSYEVYFNTTNNLSTATLFAGDPDNTDTTCIITGLTNGTPYYVWVKAKNSAGTSDASPVATGTPVAASWPGTVQFGSTEFDSAEGIALDASGNIYVGGYTYGAFPGFPRATTDGDATIVKLDPSGTITGSYQSLMANDDYIYGVVVDGENNLIVTGIKHDIDYNATSFISKYNSDLTLLWSRDFPITDYRAYAVTVDGSNNIYAAGDTPSPFGNGFVIKYDKAGNYQWTGTVGTATDEREIKGVATDGSHVYITGMTMGTFPGNSLVGEYDAFVAKLRQTDGVQVAVKQFGTTQNDDPRRIVVDSTRNVVWVVGYTNGSFPGFTIAGASDVFVARLGTAALDLLDTKQFGTVGGGNDEAWGIDLDASGNAYVGGVGVRSH